MKSCHINLENYIKWEQVFVQVIGSRIFFVASIGTGQDI